MTAPNGSSRLSRGDEAPDLQNAACTELTLIVSGGSDLSARAIAQATLLLEGHMKGRYHLSVVDLHEAPPNLLSGDVLAAPTLVKTEPLPMRKFVGDLSRTEMVLAALGLPAPGAPSRPRS